MKHLRLEIISSLCIVTNLVKPLLAFISTDAALREDLNGLTGGGD